MWISTLYCGPATRTGKRRGREGSGLYPELAVLGIREGSSPALASEVGRLTALLPSYEVARAELVQRGMPFKIKVVHRIASQLGAEILTTRTRDLQRYRAGDLPAGRVLAGKRVGVAIDGGRTRIRTVIRKQKGRGKGKKQRRKFNVEWREPKVLIIFEMDRKGRMAAKPRPWIDGTFAGPDEALELLAMHLHRLGAAAAQVVVFLADGAPWIWDRLDWVVQRVGLPASRTVRVLDFCHAAHHISLALQAVGLEDAERQRLYRRCRKWLRTGHTSKLIAELTVLAWDLPEESPAWVAIAYLEKHQGAGHLGYDQFRRRGLSLGSGAIESAIRRVVNLRLKGSGLLWLEENAEAVLVMRAAVLTERWQETLSHVRTTMASDRRLEWHWQSPDMPAELKAGLPIAPPGSQPQAKKGSESDAA
ncbi:MAG TPA: hypothetical protein VKU02_19650 [Gemmataceae bacterium]|nr:hypothetical protein [Gemmataceae bacterium]